MTGITVKNYAPPPWDLGEILRYCGAGGEGGKALSSLMEECIREAETGLHYRVCFRELTVSCKGDQLDMEFAQISSENLRNNLSGCKRAVVFAATVGLELDRLIVRYSRLSPTKAVLLQAIGAQRIESLCDAFCEELREAALLKGEDTAPRFSPGYGDLPLSLQRDIFRVLDCERKIGLTLNESLLMSPTKSVTAFVGLRKGEKGEPPQSKACSHCEKTDCAYRRES